MNENYPSASEVVRNIADLKIHVEVLAESGFFRIVRIAPPYFSGYEYWVINEEGFLWEPAVSLEEAKDYLSSPEAQAYEG